MNKRFKKTVAYVVATFMLFSFCSVSFAGGYNKDETVYGLLYENGSIKNTYVINSFEDYGEEIVDYGDYETVTNLTSQSAIINENGKITATAPNIKFYYEGKVASPKIPWNIAITYKLDDVAVAGAEIIDKSGKVTIEIDVSKNDQVDPLFFNNYMLQISTTLDTAKCKNIVASGANIANIGESKNVTFTMLPKKAGKFTITTDAKNFSMGAISINGLPFSMAFDIGGLEGLTGGLGQLDDGIAGIDNGVKKLNSGARELKSGMEKLNENASKLTGGSKAFLDGLTEISKAMEAIKDLGGDTGGIAKLKEASAQYKTGMETLSKNALPLKASSKNISKGIKDSAGGLKDIAATDPQVEALIKELKAKNDPQVNAFIDVYRKKMGGVYAIGKGLKGLSDNYIGFDNGINGVVDGLKSLSDNYASIHGGIVQIELNIDSLKALADTFNLLVENYKKLDAGLNQFTDGYSEVVSGFSKISDGLVELKTGTSRLKTSTAGIDQKITSAIDEKVKEISNSDFKPVSFTSDKNKNIALVQFVIRTDALEIKKPVSNVEEEPKQLSFFEKFMALFDK